MQPNKLPKNVVMTAIIIVQNLCSVCYSYVTRMYSCGVLVVIDGEIPSTIWALIASDTMVFVLMR